MNKKFSLIFVGLLLISLIVISACAQNRGTGYATYGNNVPPPRVTGSGGGCGVGAPTNNGNDAANNIAKTFANNNL